MSVKRLILFALAFWVALWAVREALAETCAPFEGVRATLQSDYGETARFHGLTADAGALLVVTLNDASGTWTVLLVTPDGRACLVGAGSVGAVVTAAPKGVPG